MSPTNNNSIVDWMNAYFCQGMSRFAKIIQNAIKMLDSGSKVMIELFNANEIIVNPGKFQLVMQRKVKQIYLK